MVKTIVAEPMEVKLPDYFIVPGKMNIVQNSNMGFDFYQSMKPVHPESHKSKKEL